MDKLTNVERVNLEKTYVRDTYEKIAEDFSATRHKKWPKVDSFLRNLDNNSLVLDVGCGNGKYLDNSSTYNIGCDLSLNLLKICRERNYEVVQCDMTRLPFRENIFDAMICIASLHHIVDDKRRHECIHKMSDLLVQDAKFLVQVWAFEQELDSKNPYLRNKPSVSTQLEGSLWVGDLTNIPVHRNRTPFAQQDLLVPFKIVKSEQLSSSSGMEHQLRYYHLFKVGELDKIVEGISTIHMVESYYDCGNWCLVAKKI